MRTRLLNLWEKLRTSFWLIPSTMVTASVGAFFILLDLDRKYQFDAFLFFSFLEPISASGARILLSTIAGSMITVAGTVFSITIVTLTLASTQFGPRLLRNFMGSSVNQVVLGSYISTFVFCLFLLGSVEPAGQENFVPGLSVNFAVLMALFNVGILIYFIHHVATSIQVETVIHNINNDLIKNIQEFFPEKSKEKNSKAQASGNPKPETTTSGKMIHIAASEYGYLQAIDNDAIEKLAHQHKISLRLEQKPGTYITRGMALISLEQENSLDEDSCNELRNAFLLGPERTSEQDVEYSIHQLVEIAVRALSPGVNDPYTALGCIDYLGSLMCRITDREFPAAHSFDQDNNVLVTYKIVTFEGIVAAAFDQVRQHSQDNAAVLIRLLEVFHNAIQQTEDASQRNVLLRQAKMTHRSGMKNLPEELDRQDVEERFQLISKLLQSETERPNSQ